MKLSQLEKQIQQTLTNSKDIIQKGWKSLHRSDRARSTRGQANEAWVLYKLNPSRVSWGDLSREWYIACPKLASVAGNTVAQVLLFTWASCSWRQTAAPGLWSILNQHNYFRTNPIQSLSKHAKLVKHEFLKNRESTEESPASNTKPAGSAELVL